MLRSGQVGMRLGHDMSSNGRASTRWLTADGEVASIFCGSTHALIDANAQHNITRPHMPTRETRERHVQYVWTGLAVVEYERS